MNDNNLNFENEENMNSNELYQLSSNIKNQYLEDDDQEQEEKQKQEFDYNNEEDLNINLNNNNYQENNIQSNLSNIEKVTLNNSIYNNSFLTRRLKPNLIRLISQVFNDEILYSILSFK